VTEGHCGQYYNFHSIQCASIYFLDPLFSLLLAFFQVPAIFDGTNKRNMFIVLFLQAHIASPPLPREQSWCRSIFAGRVCLKSFSNLSNVRDITRLFLIQVGISVYSHAEDHFNAIDCPFFIFLGA
jgi:hypothetical protein